MTKMNRLAAEAASRSGRRSSGRFDFVALHAGYLGNRLVFLRQARGAYFGSPRAGFTAHRWRALLG